MLFPKVVNVLRIVKHATNILELGGNFEVLGIFNYFLKKEKKGFFEIQFLINQT
jgi:hypothetical protein